MKSKILVIVIAIMVLGMVYTVSGVDIDDIEVELSKTETGSKRNTLEIEPGDDFWVHITLENPDENESDVDVTITIMIEDNLVYERDWNNIELVEGEDKIISIASGSFNEDWFENEWEKNLMGYLCGDYEIEGELDDDIEETDGATLEINGDEFDTVSMDPEKPSVDDKVTIYVEDDRGDEFDDVNVKFTRLGDDDSWDEDQNYRKGTTDNDGEYTTPYTLFKDSRFNDDPYGKYQVDVWYDGYCKETFTFDARRTLKITEIPDNPKAGSTIKVKVTDDNDNGLSGATVGVSASGGYQEFYNTDSGGYASFIISSPGTYSLVASKEDYMDSSIGSITVQLMGSIGPSISPADSVVGSAVTIAVKSTTGSPFVGATVIVTLPDGNTERFTTSSDGKVMYTPTTYGTYSVNVEADAYNPATGQFKAHNTLKITTSGEMKVNTDIKVTVRDQADNSVSGASFTVGGQSGTTDSNGEFLFKPGKPGDYTITIKKTGYTDVSESISVTGGLSIQLSATEISLDENITVAVVDDDGNEISADLQVTKPEGGKESIGEIYTPKNSGNYIVSASKEGYQTVTAGFEVSRRALDLTSTIKNNRLSVIAMSSGVPVKSIIVTIDAPLLGEPIDIVTDDLGIATLDISNLNVTGNLTISVNERNYDEVWLSQEIPGEGTGTYLWLIIAIVAVIGLGLAILYLTTTSKIKGTEEKSGSSRKESSPDDKTKSVFDKGKKKTSLHK